jgi:hypothetical protein
MKELEESVCDYYAISYV